MNTLTFLVSLLAMGQPNVFVYALRPPAVIISQILHALYCLRIHNLHPLPDKDRSRIANAVSGLNSTTRSCHTTSHRLGQTIQ